MTVIARLPTAVNPGATLHASEDDPASNDQDFTERVEFIRRQPVRLPAIFLRENKTKSPPMGQRIWGVQFYSAWPRRRRKASGVRIVTPAKRRLGGKSRIFQVTR